MDLTVPSGGVAELPRPGEIVCSKYRIDSIVGVGGMGVVMGALDTSLGRPVAIKFLTPHRATRPGAGARFLREARAAASIQSEHVVRVFEVSTLPPPNNAPFIVMEHLRGADLSQVLQQRGALPIDEACDLLLQACEALGEAHALGIVHRDLKPQNLFLTQRPDGSPCLKVLDFGISKAIDDESPNLTSTDMVMGTPLYMSPEQVRSLKNVDARADIWALGSILFELLTMCPIYDAPTASALCAMIAMDPPTPLRMRRPQSPPELEAVILRCLHKDPAGRFRDVAELAEALAPFATERGRLSATRVSRIVRAGTGPSPFGTGPSPFGAGGTAPTAGGASVTGTAAGGFGTLGTGPTAGDPRLVIAPSTSNFPPMGAAGAGPSHPPMHMGGPHPTTQSTWHHTSGGATAPPPKRASGVLIAGLGVLTGLALLSVAGGSAWYFVIHKENPAAAATAAPVVDASAPAAATAAATATLTSTPAVTTSAPAPRPAPSPTSAKDAGAPPAPDKDKLKKEEDARNAELGRQAESRCKNHTMQMTTFARDDATRKRAATQAKTFTCRGLVSSRCEREVCKNACMILGDDACIRQIQYVIDKGPTPKY